jgi:signal transduction histidine kinase/ligand-binding sensor domain-containing protein
MSGLTRVLFLLVILSARSALALDPDRHISELAHRAWGAKEGVPTDVWSLAQTTDGYLWIGSATGLFRFDGVRARPFEPESGSKLPAHHIQSLFASPDGRLWIGWRGGVSVLEAGKLTNFGSSDGLPPGYVWGFSQDRRGRIWAASEGGLVCFEGGRWRRVGVESDFPGSMAQAVLTDHRGALWVAGEHRIAVLLPDASKFALTDEPYDGQVANLAESSDGTVWMAEATRALRPLGRPGEAVPFRGISRAECQHRFPATWQTESRCQRPDDLEIRVGSFGLLFDRQGSFWITTLGDGLRRAPNPPKLPKEPIAQFSTALEQFTSKDGLSADYGTAILEDREGNIWVGTRYGIDQFHNSAVVPVSLGAETSQWMMVPGDDGDVIVIGTGGNLYRFHDGRRKPLIVGSDMHYLYRDPNGSVWATGYDGACRLVDLKCTDTVNRPGSVSLSYGLRPHFASDKAGRQWAYTDKEGLFVRENGRWNAVPGAPVHSPRTEFTDPAGHLWFGLENGELVNVGEGGIRTYSSDDGLTIGDIKVVYSDGVHVWVGGDRGLALLRGTRFVAVVPDDAPAFESVSGIVQADDGSLWLNEYRGIIRVSTAEVTAIVKGSMHRPHYALLTALDGLPGDTVQNGTFPTAIRGSDGRLWFATTRGPAWVDPRHLYGNKFSPPIVVQSVVADGRPFSPYGKLELPARTINLQIAYSALSLSIPERVEFRYRLRGLDHEWQSVGTQRTAYYTRLSPGSYDFQVIASNDTGVWNEVGATLPFRVIPAWYQTWWFYSLSALLVTAALAALYRLRVARVRVQTRRLLEARLSERERIARDLHDTLLQEVQGLIWRFQAATNSIPRDQPARQMMEQSLDRADKVLEASRDRVKDLRPIVSEVADLTRALAAEGEQLAQHHSAKFRVSVQGGPRELHPTVRDEGFLIAREAITNAFRHSDAKQIEVEVTYGDAALNIRIRDDGTGISASVLEAGGKPGHFGLVGMRERAKKLGGELEIWSKPEAGTEINLQVPAQAAYRSLHAQSSRARSSLNIFRFFAKSR